MTTSEVLSPPPPAAVASMTAAPQLDLLPLSGSVGADLVNAQTGDLASFARSSWHNGAGKASGVSRRGP